MEIFTGLHFNDKLADEAKNADRQDRDDPADNDKQDVLRALEEVEDGRAGLGLHGQLGNRQTDQRRDEQHGKDVARQERTENVVRHNRLDVVQVGALDNAFGSCGAAHRNGLRREKTVQQGGNRGGKNSREQRVEDRMAEDLS